ncbi:MAG: FtsX-like permease family protein [Lachnospiraceae bacterium]
MYLQMLKKDLKRKKTMNVILLIFIILAAMFIASSANNMVTVMNAIDYYFEKANVPDYWTATASKEESDKLIQFAKKKDCTYSHQKMLQIDPKNVKISGKTFTYGNTLCLSKVPKSGTKVFESNANEITQVKDGEIYVTNDIFSSTENTFQEGCKIVIEENGVKKTFRLKGYTKDVMFGSAMMGTTRFLVSDKDFELFEKEDSKSMEMMEIYTKDTEFMRQLQKQNIKTIMNLNYAKIKLMYIMDMLMAAIVLIVSICLILISMVILHFTIHFTMSEEFCEIGVMKAIGITNGRIRGLYIVKYLAISTVGSLIGLLLSFPFGNMLLENVSKNIIIAEKENEWLNVIFAIVTAVVVVAFCYFCTRNVKKFSPIDAIRNGETGERYNKKGVIHLSRSKLTPIPFLAWNDIFSGWKKHISMILIFTIGILLIIIPVNTINTLQSDRLIQWFNMAECDHVIAQELLFTPDGDNKKQVEERIAEVKCMLHEHQIHADVYEEVMFRFPISHGDKQMSSLAFQGVGDITTDQYPYLQGTPPQNEDEIAISYLVADEIGVKIGDDVEVSIGEQAKTYTVTAFYQTMNNMGEGMRFYQKEKLDYQYATGCFGLQIRYKDHPDQKTLEEREELLKKCYPKSDVYTAGEYINKMIGDVAGQLQSVKKLIFGIVLCINVLVAVLMVRSFLTKEKREIAVLKAIGFQDRCLIRWQSMRIGIVLVISILLGELISTPLTKLLVEPVFRTMGAYSIEFEILPFEVYVKYPLVILIVTVLASITAAMKLKKISASDRANME